MIPRVGVPIRKAAWGCVPEREVARQRQGEGRLVSGGADDATAWASQSAATSASCAASSARKGGGQAPVADPFRREGEPEPGQAGIRGPGLVRSVPVFAASALANQRRRAGM